ncbi:hypothetical protein CW734_08315 [Planococcus sp. MB-3u-03]|uniref:hypothetical protein n=1 Tax=unclassified Planococcus (in: firmicutes) TaxID=2662419 RepID=UPI000C33CC47|nr:MULTISPECIES: hypothetical protein [unclassified Planococcus (in: firmicutes)]AUD13653.1 hypothetical protein CW734_08315 [Planococcus sp. MB-3u-03]PKG44450.1 hypothetical protein CXF66_17050 [Planococcus sp. Urea-trap-24]PKG91266.1 hypothetical protein CXF91_02755 [Planococcus sp. Urea-3u-39]
MKKLMLVNLLLMLVLLCGCSSNESALEKAPPYIKETWFFYESMSKATDALDGGEHVDIAFDKHFSNESEIISYIDSASSETEEEELVNLNIHLMHLQLSTLGIANFNESMGGETVDVEQFVYDLQVPRYELAKIYDKYGLEYEE